MRTQRQSDDTIHEMNACGSSKTTVIRCQELRYSERRMGPLSELEFCAEFGSLSEKDDDGERLALCFFFFLRWRRTKYVTAQRNFQAYSSLQALFPHHEHHPHRTKRTRTPKQASRGMALNHSAQKSNHLVPVSKAMTNSRGGLNMWPNYLLSIRTLCALVAQ